jgi:hypothetical protein
MISCVKHKTKAKRCFIKKEKVFSKLITKKFNEDKTTEQYSHGEHNNFLA